MPRERGESGDSDVSGEVDYGFSSDKEQGGQLDFPAAAGELPSMGTDERNNLVEQIKKAGAKLMASLETAAHVGQPGLSFGAASAHAAPSNLEHNQLYQGLKQNLKDYFFEDTFNDAMRGSLGTKSERQDMTVALNINKVLTDIPKNPNIPKQVKQEIAEDLQLDADHQLGPLRADINTWVDAYHNFLNSEKNDGDKEAMTKANSDLLRAMKGANLSTAIQGRYQKFGEELVGQHKKLDNKQ